MKKSLTPNEETALKRLKYRSWHRGCKETDLILGPFSDTGLSALSSELMALYERFLEEDDAQIWDWMTEKNPPKPEYVPLIAFIKQST